MVMDRLNIDSLLINLCSIWIHIIAQNKQYINKGGCFWGGNTWFSKLVQPFCNSSIGNLTMLQSKSTAETWHNSVKSTTYFLCSWGLEPSCQGRHSQRAPHWTCSEDILYMDRKDVMDGMDGGLNDWEAAVKVRANSSGSEASKQKCTCKRCLLMFDNVVQYNRTRHLLKCFYKTKININRHLNFST